LHNEKFYCIIANAVRRIASDSSGRKSYKERGVAMRFRFVPLSIALVVTLVMVLAFVFVLLGTSSAAGQYPAQVIPKVNVESGGSLSITGGTTGEAKAIDFGNMGPGQTLEKTLSLGITANDDWHLTVSKNQDLKDSFLNATIPSANFTFTSSGGAVATYVESSTQFGNSDTAVVTNGSATGGSNVNVVYKLVIPSGQPCNDPLVSYYAAVHTYTLIVGSP